MYATAKRTACSLFCLTFAGSLFFAVRSDEKRPALSVDTVHATSYTVSASHPRVWLTPSRLSVLRDYKNRNTARWQVVKAVADSGMGVTPSSPYDSAYDPALCMVYQVTGDETYAQKAIQIALNTAVPTEHASGGQYYDFRDFIPNVTAAYDWCYDQLTSSQKQQLATWLMDRSDEVWPDSTPSRSGGWAISDAANNYYYGFLMSWPAALAVYGDGTDTGIGAISGSNRPKYHVDLGLSKFANQVRPITDGWGAGGLFPESVNYDSVHFLSSILDAHLTATGQNLFAASGFSFLSDSLYWRIHSTTPDLAHEYPLGDQPREADANLVPTDRYRALIPAVDAASPLLRQYIQSWLNTITPDHTSVGWAQDAAIEFLYYNEDAVATDYRNALPTSYFAQGAGLFVDRSSWQSDATYWGIWAGPLLESHQSHDVNGFKIYKAGWLVGDANIYSASGILQDTNLFNNLTFGGLNQSWQTPDSTWPKQAGETLKHEAGSDYSYFAGQAAQAYVQDRSHGGVQVAADYVRKLVSLGANDFLVYDRVTLADPNKAKEFHLQSQKPVTVNGRSYSWDNGSYKLFGTSLLPALGTTVSTEPVFSGNTPALTSGVAAGANSLQISSDYFSAVSAGSVLQLGASASHELATVQSVSASGPSMTLTLTAPLAHAHPSGETLTVRSSNRLNVVTANNQATDHLLNSLEIGPMSQVSAMARRSLAASTGQMEGAELDGTGWAVLFGKDSEQVADTVSYQTVSHQSHHLVLDLRPNYLYTLTVRNGSGSQLRTVQLTSTANGSLKFASADPAEVSYTLTPQGSAPVATVTLNKSVDKTTANSGDTLTYTITYTNVGTASAQNVVISDPVPAGTSYIQGSATGGGEIDGGVLSWVIQSLAQGASGTVSFKVSAN